MRIIIKPFGLVVLTLSVIILGLLALRNTPMGGTESGFGGFRNGIPLIKNQSAWLPTGTDVAGTRLTAVPVSGQPFASALQLRTTSVPSVPWAAQIDNRAAASMKKGDVLVGVFYGRVIEGKGKVEFVVEHNVDPYTKAVSQEVTLTKEWKRYAVPFRAAETLQPDQIGVHFRLGFAAQTVELADIQVYNLQNRMSLEELTRSIQEKQ